MNTPFSLSNADRANVRRVITSHPDWTEYRTNAGITASDLTSARCLIVCEALGIDITDAVAGKAQQAMFKQEDVAQAVKPTPAPAQQATPAVGAGDELQALQALKTLFGAGPVDRAQVEAIVSEALAPVIETLGKPTLRVVDAAGNAKGKDLPPTRHERADDLLAACSARDTSGFCLNVWISGPAGSGKTYGAKQIADALGLEFGFHGAMTMAHELLGFVDAGGTYHETVFVRLFRDGGLCLLDEVDAGSSEALLALNAALANGQMSLPNGQIIERHTDFVCIGAGNTWGAGATADYVGRARIDAAFLDRFGARIAWDYDTKLETNICGNPDWSKRVQKAREKARKAGLKVLITPRSSISGAALIAGGMTEDQAAKLTYLAGLTSEQVNQLKG